MGKQHQTFPGEQPEIPAPKKNAEIKQPADPKEPEIPAEDPDRVPEELPKPGDEPDQ
jgi:hypothetical protein